MTFQKESGKEGLKILLMLASVIIITAGLLSLIHISEPTRPY